MKKATWCICAVAALLIGHVGNASAVACLYEMSATFIDVESDDHTLAGTFWYDDDLAGSDSYSDWSITSRFADHDDFTFVPSNSEFLYNDLGEGPSTDIGPYNLALIAPLSADFAAFWLRFEDPLGDIGFGETGNIIRGGETGSPSFDARFDNDLWNWYKVPMTGTVTKPGAPIPEPGTLLLLSLGLLGPIAILRLRRAHRR